MFARDDEKFSPGNNESLTKKERTPILSNHTVYQYKGSEGWEHDDTGSMQNYSGCCDDMMNPTAEHEGWEAGYDY